jgi:hypothetical protein
LHQQPIQCDLQHVANVVRLADIDWNIAEQGRGGQVEECMALGASASSKTLRVNPHELVGREKLRVYRIRERAVYSKSAVVQSLSFPFPELR